MSYFSQGSSLRVFGNWDFSGWRFYRLRIRVWNEIEKEIVEINRESLTGCGHGKRQRRSIDQKPENEVTQDKIVSSEKDSTRSSHRAASSTAPFTDYTIFFIRGYPTGENLYERELNRTTMMTTTYFLVTQRIPHLRYCTEIRKCTDIFAARRKWLRSEVISDGMHRFCDIF